MEARYASDQFHHSSISELTGNRASFFKVLTLGSETLVTFDLIKGEHWGTAVRWWGDGGR